ncbi:hypothetical protein [Chitinophaga sp. Cy-1792]|uniref:hypothetical protein n=1 Tax=Chitinophaga sp. Cy-1792 TaxID=2608339 RepID=UPI0014204391|nr:hypothetical protein [Chitinophaga sp. Cy-1792]NIG55964.1 hypothetical protein [Chitinophaga sp. Cy-1792]
MTSTEFWILYLPALRQALDNDDINEGFLVRGPECYLDAAQLPLVDDFITSVMAEDPFLILVEEYFDAKTHYAESFKGQSILIVREEIVRKMEEKTRLLNSRIQPGYGAES